MNMFNPAYLYAQDNKTDHTQTGAELTILPCLSFEVLGLRDS